MIVEKFFYHFMTLINRVIPKDNMMIVVYGRSMLDDNAEALLNYLESNKYYTRYKLYLLIKSNVKHYFGENIHVVSNVFLTIFYTLRSKYVFHTHGLSLCQHKPSRGQLIFNMWHGTPLKAIGTMIGSAVRPESDTFFLCSSPFAANINKCCFKITTEQVFIGSNPRNDSLFHKVDVKSIMGWESYEKVIVFMPTFRKSKAVSRLDADKDFPLINKQNIEDINSFLIQKSILLVIKPHPYQDCIDFLNNRYSNISVLYNEDIRSRGIKLYELLGNTDALITDFSSVFFDYLTTNKPIAFAIDDMDSYSKNRGYTVDNPMDLMPGKKINTVEGLLEFFESILSGEDQYQEDRKNINRLVNSYITPYSSRRILDYLGIKN